MSRIIVILSLIFTFNTVLADLDINNEIIFESQIKASDLNLKFQELNSLLTAKGLSTLNFNNFNIGDEVDKNIILTELSKVNSVTGIVSRIYALNDTIDSQDINEEFDFAENAINAIQLSTPVTINKNLDLAYSDPSAPELSSNIVGLEVLSNTLTDTEEIDSNTLITLTAEPKSLYNFINWTGNVCNLDTNVVCSFTVGTNSINVTANFEVKTCNSIDDLAATNPTLNTTGINAVTGGDYINGCQYSCGAGYLPNTSDPNVACDATIDIQLITNVPNGIVGDIRIRDSNNNIVDSCDGNCGSKTVSLVAGANYTTQIFKGSGVDFVAWVDNGNNPCSSFGNNLVCSFVAQAGSAIEGSFDKNCTTQSDVISYNDNNGQPLGNITDWSNVLEYTGSFSTGCNYSCDSGFKKVSGIDGLACEPLPFIDKSNYINPLTNVNDTYQHSCNISAIYDNTQGSTNMRMYSVGDFIYYYEFDNTLTPDRYFKRFNINTTSLPLTPNDIPVVGEDVLISAENLSHNFIPNFNTFSLQVVKEPGSSIKSVVYHDPANTNNDKMLSSSVEKFDSIDTNSLSESPTYSTDINQTPAAIYNSFYTTTADPSTFLRSISRIDVASGESIELVAPTVENIFSQAMTYRKVNSREALIVRDTSVFNQYTIYEFDLLLNQFIQIKTIDSTLYSIDDFYTNNYTLNASQKERKSIELSDETYIYVKNSVGSNIYELISLRNDNGTWVEDVILSPTANNVNYNIYPSKEDYSENKFYVFMWENTIQYKNVKLYTLTFDVNNIPQLNLLENNVYSFNSTAGQVNNILDYQNDNLYYFKFVGDYPELFRLDTNTDISYQLTDAADRFESQYFNAQRNGIIRFDRSVLPIIPSGDGIIIFAQTRDNAICGGLEYTNNYFYFPNVADLTTPTAGYPNKLTFGESPLTCQQTRNFALALHSKNKDGSMLFKMSKQLRNGSTAPSRLDSFYLIKTSGGGNICP